VFDAILPRLSRVDQSSEWPAAVAGGNKKGPANFAGPLFRS
jgi:hypothetical protein